MSAAPPASDGAARRRFFVPEVVQTSAMDCGPAALKALLEGFWISASYGRLREACQTQVDGTSIDTLEVVANQLGLQAEQIMLPSDHLLLPEAKALPALVVARLPDGATHFIVVWSVHGGFVQVMDPATGRRWMTDRRLLSELFIHRFPFPTAPFRGWLGSEHFRAPLRRRLEDLEVPSAEVTRLLAEGEADPGWRGLTSLDAATRMVASLVRAGGLPRGEATTGVLERFFAEARAAESPAASPIPAAFWFAEPLPGEPEQVLLRGAVVVRVIGPAPSSSTSTEGPAADRLPPELVAALREPPARPTRELWRVLRKDGLFIPALVAAAALLASFGVMIEAVLLESLMRLSSALKGGDARPHDAHLVVVATVSAFVLLLFALELPLTLLQQRLGRRLEARLRVLLFEKIPRLGDRYFHSRLTSDMAARAHGLAAMRDLPSLGLAMARLGLQLVLTAAGVAILSPASAPWALGLTALLLAVAVAGHLVLREREMRIFALEGGLNRVSLDALLGLIPVRMHGAERSLRREHEGRLTEWARASLEGRRIVASMQAIAAAACAAFAVLTIAPLAEHGAGAGNLLLLFYWTLSLPALAHGLFASLQRYPQVRNHMLRLLEPLGAPDEAGPPGDPPAEGAASEPATTAAASIHLDAVTVRAGGHRLLEDVSLIIAPGEHVAIVGASGAGKSTLLGVLLGWHTPASGACRVDGAPLDGERVRALRRVTAWVDPAVQLWNRSLLGNLRYGGEPGDSAVEAALEGAELYGVLERLPEGMQTPLGENGGLVSGGEGQRVRLGRALHRSDVRLVLLDEPFRGLDREARGRLLRKARERWRGATLLCVTHDVGETLSFGRVLVVDGGRLMEDDAPARLAAREGSRYRALLDAEQGVRQRLWEGPGWRRWWLEAGALRETGDGVDEEP